MDHTHNLDIKANFSNFKNGLIERINNKYVSTNESLEAIEKIKPVKMNQAIESNIFCKEILPIMWNAIPPQNEKDYCSEKQTIFVKIGCNPKCNKELKVRSYFHGNIRGNCIKGGFLQSEFDKINIVNINLVIKEVASREVFEETGIKLIFIDENICVLSVYDNEITCQYYINTNINKHYVTIQLTCPDYELLKQIFIDNLDQQKKFMENSGEISGLIL